MTIPVLPLYSSPTTKFHDFYIFTSSSCHFLNSPLDTPMPTTHVYSHILLRSSSRIPSGSSPTPIFSSALKVSYMVFTNDISFHIRYIFGKESTTLTLAELHQEEHLPVFLSHSITYTTFSSKSSFLFFIIQINLSATKTNGNGFIN